MNMHPCQDVQLCKCATLYTVCELSEVRGVRKCGSDAQESFSSHRSSRGSTTFKLIRREGWWSSRTRTHG